jgi:hypothetical protein
MSTIRKVLATDQTLTGAYVDLGTSPEIDVKDYDLIGVIINAVVNDSENVDMQAVGVDADYGEHEVDGFNEISLWTTGASDFAKYYEYEVGALMSMKLQIKAGTLGATPGVVSAVITKAISK